MTVFTSPIGCSLGLLFTAVISLAFSPTAKAAVLLNGGFELGTVSVDGHGETPLPWISSVPLDPSVSWDTWHNSGVNGLPPAFQSLFTSTLAPEGVRWVGGWNFENIAQQLSAPLTPGQTYLLSAQLRMADNSFLLTGRMDVYLGAGVASYDQLIWSSQSVTYADGWLSVSSSFIAPASSGGLPYFLPKFVSESEGWQVYMGLDNIQLTAVPEPNLATMLNLGLALVFGFRRKK